MVKKLFIITICLFVIGCGRTNTTQIDLKEYNNCVTRLFNAKTIKCHWENGVAARYQNNRIDITRAQFTNINNNKDAATIVE